MTQSTLELLELEFALRRAAGVFMAEFAPDLPEIFWSVETNGLSGFVSHRYHEDPRAVAEQWAERLGLTDECIRCGNRTLASLIRLPGIGGSLFNAGVPIAVQVWHEIEAVVS
ncbi:hypothetical protein ACWCW7_34495 [Nocardia tengchongensis]